MTAASSAPLLLLLGGSFNPPHIGHMRIALETAEATGPHATLFIPAALPPHKSCSNLLPFALRCEMLRAAIADRESETGRSGDFTVCEIEAEREGPSYTVDTLAILAARFPGLRPAFIMGGEDYSRLDTWRNWRKIPEYADLVVLPRNAGGRECFNRISSTFWPEAEPLEPPAPGVRSAFRLPHGGRLLYVPHPRLEVSSSLVRGRYLAGRSLDFLVPPGTLRLLRQNGELAQSLWERTDAACAK